MVTKMDYKESTEYVLSIPLFADKLGTDCLNQILDRLGHPERSYPVIHIAGTNGKGSTCAFLSSMLQAAGYQVGMFTSPHLIKINERMQIDEKTITDDEWTEVFEEVMHAVEEAKKDYKEPSSDIMRDIDKSFYTKSMDLSDKDFFTDEDDDNEKHIPVIVKVLLILILVALVAVGACFLYQSL